MQNPPPVQTTKSSTGLDENVAALLSYIFGWVSGLIFFLIEKDSRLVRFHAMQSILLNVAAVVIGIALWILWALLALVFSQISDVIAGLVSVVFGLVMFVFYIGLLLAVVLCLVKA